MTHDVIVGGVPYVSGNRGHPYVDRFLKLKCAPSLLGIGWTSKPSKEISESMAARQAVVDHISRVGVSRNDPDVVCVCVADGTSSRTAALIAYTTAWQVHAVDPAAVPARTADVRRLTVHPCTLSEAAIPVADRVVVCAVHSHAPWAEVGQLCNRYAAGLLVAMPCCVHPEMPIVPGAKRRRDKPDLDCLSAARRVIVETWNFDVQRSLR